MTHGSLRFPANDPGAAGIRMRIILQHRKSRLYLEKLGQWTDDVETALDFTHLIAAVDFVQFNQISTIDVLMHFGDPRYDVRLSASM